MLIGGYNGSCCYSQKTYFFDVPTLKWIPGPSTITAHRFHGCGILTNNYQNLVVIVGGYGDSTVEILDLATPDKWNQG